MRCLIIVFCLAAFANPVFAQGKTQFDIDDLRWRHRVLIVFAADSTQKFAEPLLNQIERYQSDFLDRDMVFIGIFSNASNHVDGQFLNELSIKKLKARFGAGTSSFRVLLIGKDGGVKLDQQVSTDLNDIFALIDTMPMRRSEMKQKG